MDKAIYTAMSGASQTMLKQQIHSNNLANINTNGFRADYATSVAKNVQGWRSADPCYDRGKKRLE